jgi:hypothetical protein
MSTSIPTSSAGWLTRQPIRRGNVAQHVEEFANNAAQLGREAGERVQEVASNIKGAATRAAVEEGIVTGGRGLLPKVASR